MGFPRCGRPEPDVRLRWKPRLVEAPTPQLTPVERRYEPCVFDRKVVGPRTVKNLARQFPDPNTGLARPAHHATNDARPDVTLVGPVYRHSRGRDNQTRDLFVVIARGTNLREKDVENQASRRDGPYRIDQARHCCLIKKRESYPLREVAEFGFHRVDDLAIGTAGDHEHLVR